MDAKEKETVGLIRDWLDKKYKGNKEVLETFAIHPWINELVTELQEQRDEAMKLLESARSIYVEDSASDVDWEARSKILFEQD